MATSTAMIKGLTETLGGMQKAQEELTATMEVVKNEVQDLKASQAV